MTKVLREDKYSDVLPTGEFWERLARSISAITNPLYVALPTFLLVALHTAPDLLRGFVWWVVTVVCITVAPLLFIWRGVRRGRYSDGHLSIREQRIIPLLFGLLCAGAALIVLLLLQVAVAFLATVVAVLVGGVVTMIITKYWTKMSLHLVGITGAVTVLVLVFGPFLLVVSPLILLVGWARWRVRAHTLLQMVLAGVLALGITAGIFKLFGV